ncbi:rhomboid family intramembrane serine protease [Leucobacter albus]|uniref:Rhomboid family intramembrane serine protease n=1 Tax=Leucobacter albus TaxID=272210 RepID=A0ABW3TK40_9MICO
MATSGPSFGERAEYGESDVCYRHPGRQSFTLCQRCGRTICAECQIQSPVGVLCRDCVKQTSAGPKGAARVGRSARVAGRRFAALEYPVTMSIIAINVIVFVLQLLSNHFGTNGVTTGLWYVPTYSLADGMHEVAPGALAGYPDGAYVDAQFQPWRMLTVMFTHSVGFLPHILFNMLALFMFGRNLEQMIGKWRFLALYLLAGLGGSLGVMLWGYADTVGLFTPTVGASGAIFGVLAATVVAFRSMNVNATSLIVLLAINFGIGFMPGASISWQAHLGGMIVGAIAMWIIVQTRGPRLQTRQTIWLAVLAAALVALSCAFLVVSPL